MVNGWKAASTVPRRVARRFGWGLADQMVSSLSNAALSFYVARVLGATAFGAFSLAYVTYSFALNASRGLATDPLLVRFSGAQHTVWRRAVAKCTGTALVVGMVTGASSLAAAAVLSGTARLAFLALGLTLPGLLLQDSWRYAFFAVGRGSQAFLNDAVWTLAIVPPMLFLRFTHHSTVFLFVLAWGLAATVAACVGPIQARVIPNPSSAWEWVSTHRDLGPRYLAENTANSGSSQLRIYGVGLIAGLAAVGYVQAAGLLMGPFLVVFMGISLVTVPEAARILRRSPHRLQLYCLAIGVALSVLGLLWGLVLLVALPRGLGNLLLGKQLWYPAYRLVLPFTISVMGGCVISGATAGLRALGAARRSLRAMIIASVIFLVCGLVGAHFGGALGTVRGAAVATWVGALLWWWQLRLAMRESDQIPSRTKGLLRRGDAGPPEPDKVLVPGGEADTAAGPRVGREPARLAERAGVGVRAGGPAIDETRPDLWAIGGMAMSRPIGRPSSAAPPARGPGGQPYLEDRPDPGEPGQGQPGQISQDSKDHEGLGIQNDQDGPDRSGRADRSGQDAGEHPTAADLVAPAPASGSTDRRWSLPVE